MSKRPCDVCKRPVWDGGHALNERECDKTNGHVCRLVAELARKEEALDRLRNELLGTAEDIDGGDCDCEEAEDCDCGGDGDGSGCGRCWAKRLREVANGSTEWPRRALEQAPTPKEKPHG